MVLEEVSVATVLIIGSAGLVGLETVHVFAEQGFQIVGLEKVMRSLFLSQFRFDLSEFPNP